MASNGTQMQYKGMTPPAGAWRQGTGGHSELPNPEREEQHSFEWFSGEEAEDGIWPESC